MSRVTCLPMPPAAQPAPLHDQALKDMLPALRAAQAGQSGKEIDALLRLTGAALAEEVLRLRATVAVLSPSTRPLLAAG